MNMTCSKCGSPLKSVKIIYGQGVSSVASTSLGGSGTTWSGGGSASSVSQASSKTTASNALAQMCAPPQAPKKKPVWVGYLIIAAGLVVGGAFATTCVGLPVAIVAVVGGIVGGIVYMNGVKKYNMTSYVEKLQAHEEALRRWDRTLICLECGTTFVEG